MLKNRLTVLTAVMMLMFVAVPAIAATGASIFNSNGVTNAANLLDTDADYATIGASATVCPSGWTRSQGVCTYLVDIGGGHYVVYHTTGWAIVDLTADDSAADVSSITVQSSDLCTGGNCTNYTNGQGVWIFGTSDLQASNPTWTALGFCSLANDAQFSDCTKTYATAQSVEGLLVGRSNAPSKWGNIGVHSVTFE